MRKCRGVVKCSMTKLYCQLKDFESSPVESTKAERAKQLLSRLEGLDKDFRSAHLDVIYLVEDDSPDIEKE